MKLNEIVGMIVIGIPLLGFYIFIAAQIIDALSRWGKD